MSDTRAQVDHGAIALLADRDLYRAALAPIAKLVSVSATPEEFATQFSSVGEPQALLLAAWWCQVEVCNGGFYQFFENPTGILAPEAQRAFDFLAIENVADVVARAISLFGSHYPRERDVRLSALKGLELPGTKRQDRDPFSALDQEFYAHTGTGEFPVQVAAFIRQNEEMFFRLPTVH